MFVKVIDFSVTFVYNIDRKRKENKEMILAIVIIIVWLLVGVIALFKEKNSDNLVWFVVYLSLIPFFPWIFKFCGVI